MVFRSKVKQQQRVEDLVYGTHFPRRLQEDIANVKNMGFKGFRMSISWSRVIPSGRRREGVNKEGIKFYNNVINEIISNDWGLFVTIFHWDTPQALEDKYGGFLSRNIVYDYLEYANLLFEEFGDRVKYWMTFNEPWALSGFAYDDGGFCTWWMDPMTYGTYPRTVRDLVGDRLPKFTETESKFLRGSYDFLGLQYYTSYYAKPNAAVDPNHIRYKPIIILPRLAYSSWFYIFPKGIRHLLNYTKDTYNNPIIYITENGVDNNNNETQPIAEALKDEFRIEYYRKHLWNALGSLK
ncbi:hypothetical protein GH714_015047 [Hevea brasiliensis]|uniref:Uncharacterized protein n=1 Tax=Hevea brasiliensis TaxID=3981 RepID=A0A6A6N1R4_HEVBR|nr:hypothetical protein GH714_015047 [Hevea brasiliensis]